MDVHFNLNGDAFVWNAAKGQANLRKHGVCFEEAAFHAEPKKEHIYVD
jgi:uncharacterized protein